MKKKKEKREIRIFAPFRPVIRREEAEMRAHERTLEEERVKVLTFSKKITRRFYALPLIIGAFLLGFSAYIIAANMVLVAGSPEGTVLFMTAFILIGVIEVISGVLLMGG
jgi:hypothetical protein